MSLSVGPLQVHLMALPCHAPACVGYQIGDAVFVGDTIFMPDVGTARTNFPGGDARVLYRSIQKLPSFPSQPVCSCVTATHPMSELLGRPL